MKLSLVAALMSMLSSVAGQYLSSLPNEFTNAPASWAFVSYRNPAVAAIQGSFNRSIEQAPWVAQVSNPELQQANQVLNETTFIAYDEKFFELIGPKASIQRVQDLAFQVYEASCLNKNTGELFFAEWGPPGGLNGVHSWQYILDTKTNTLRNVTTNPPTFNAHGCVFYEDNYYVVTDGGPNNTGTLTKIDPETLEATVLLNNYYQQPFDGFNDIDIDEDGNFWITDGRYGVGRGLTPFSPPANPGAYFVDGKTLQPRVVYITMGEANGIAVTRKRDDGTLTVYIADTGVSATVPGQPDNRFNRRDLSAHDARGGKPLLSNERLFNNPISYFHDGVRVSRNGYVFGSAGEGVDIMDPETGYTLGTIHVGGGLTTAVNIAFGEHELWVIGGGGVWHVTNIAERLAREW